MEPAFGSHKSYRSIILIVFVYTKEYANDGGGSSNTKLEGFVSLNNFDTRYIAFF